MTALLLLLLAQDPRVPEGWTIEKISPPETAFPMFACLDDRGRLYVTESSGGDLYEELKKQVRKCKVRRYVDADADGRLESTVFAENLVPSMGIAWNGGRLYVADPPNLLELVDADGDGVEDRRRVLATGFGALDNGSLHGLTFGPDGMLYLTTGEPDGYSLPAKGGGRVTGTSGALLRCRPDGTDFEVVARGFVNLIEVVFLPGGDVVGTVNWFQKPAGGVRDALVHLVEGGLYPYVPDRGSPQPVTGDPLPPLALFPAVALSGLAVDARGDLYSAQHNTRKVQRHVLRRKGATYEATSTDLVTSENPDFHPSDVLVAADGSLVVVDTGGWYVQHCPTGNIRKSHAPGGIWRVRPPGPRPALDDPSELSIWMSAWIPVPRTPPVPFRELDGPHARTAARALGRAGRREHALSIARLLDHADPAVRLAAAEGLAGAGGPAQVWPLFNALEEDGVDPLLEHQLVFALHRLASAEALAEALKQEHPRTRKAALVLLDQRPGGAPREAVLAAVGSPDPALRRAALGILRKRKEWAKEAAVLLQAWLEKETLGAADRDGIHGTVLAFQADAGVQKTVARFLSEAGAARRLVLLDAVAETSLPELPASWVSALVLTSGNFDPAVRLAAVRTIAVLRVSFLDELLARLASDAAQSDALRLEALRALGARRPPDPSFLIGKLADRADATGRLAAAEILRRSKLGAADLAKALRAIRGDPLVSPSLLLPALDGAPDDALAAAAAELIAGGWRPSEAELGPLAAQLPDAALQAVRRAADEQREKLAAFEPLLDGGDAARGREVFFGAKVACGKCHQVGAEGGRVGPDLTKVGGIRSGRDLLESILVPGSTFAQGYEPYVAATTSGDVVSGLLARQTADAVVLRDAAGAETVLRRDRLRDLKRGEKSVMPENLERALSPAEFRDLLAYLRSLK